MEKLLSNISMFARKKKKDTSKSKRHTCQIIYFLLIKLSFNFCELIWKLVRMSKGRLSLCVAFETSHAFWSQKCAHDATITSRFCSRVNFMIALGVFFRPSFPHFSHKSKRLWPQFLQLQNNYVLYLQRYPLKRLKDLILLLLYLTARIKLNRETRQHRNPKKKSWNIFPKPEIVRAVTSAELDNDCECLHEDTAGRSRKLCCSLVINRFFQENIKF